MVLSKNGWARARGYEPFDNLGPSHVQSYVKGGRPVISLLSLVDAAIDHYGPLSAALLDRDVSLVTLRSPGGQWPIAEARQMVIYLALEEGYGLTDVARFLHHAPGTVSVARDRVILLQAYGDGEIKRELAAMRERVRRLRQREQEHPASPITPDRAASDARTPLPRARGHHRTRAPKTGAAQ